MQIGGRPLLLDLYCGAGGCSRGYHDAGFDVVGVDIKPMYRYLYPFIQADAIAFLHGLICQETMPRGDRVPSEYLLSDFAAIHASPPCEGYCRLKHLSKQPSFLIEETCDLLMRTGLPYIIENVPGAPLKASVMLCGTMFGLRTPCGAELWRHRLFETNWPINALLPPCAHYGNSRKVMSVTGDGIGVSRDKRVCSVSGTKNKPGREQTRDSLCFGNEDRKAAMQIDWMTGEQLSKAIPPPYTKWIGERLLEWVKHDAANPG